jgi:hypothetical protein
VRGYLRAPASIDLSAVTFVTRREPEFVYGDDKYNDITDDDNRDDVVTNSPEETDTTTTPKPEDATRVPGLDDENDNNTTLTEAPEIPANGEKGDGGDGDGEIPPEGDDGNRLLQLQRVWSSFRTNRKLDDGSAKQIMDLILFMVPQDCKKDSWGTCDWAKLGVGVYDGKMEGGTSYCCSADTAGRGLCDQDHIGTLIVDHSVFRGDHRKVVVPQSTDQQFKVEDPKFDIDFSGDYVFVMANCNDFGQDVVAIGSMEWKSVKGYLPGDMFELMLFYGALTVFYIFLIVWYYCGMRMYQDAAIPIQGYILGTMLLGFFEVLLRTIDFVIWNDSGLRNSGVMYTGQSFQKSVWFCLSAMKRISLPTNSMRQMSSSLIISSYVRWSPKERRLALFGGHGCDGMGSCARQFGTGTGKAYHVGFPLFRINACA